MPTPTKPTRSTASATGIIARVREASARALTAVSRAIAPPSLPPSPFEGWDYDDVEEALAEALNAQGIDTSRRATIIGRGDNGLPTVIPARGDATFPNPRTVQDPIAVNRAFYTGDHWMNGAGWIGPHPAIGDIAYPDLMGEIALAFTSQNVIAEVTDRHVLGLIGRPYLASFAPRRDLKNDETPTAQEQARIDEATALWRNWSQSRKIPMMLREMLATLLIAERSALRVYVPPGLGHEDSHGTIRVRATSIESALGMLYVEHPQPEDAAVVVDEDTKLECGTWLYERDEEYEVVTGSDYKTIQYAGLCFLDETRQTVMRSIPYDDESTKLFALDVADSTLDLGGRIPMFEMRRRALISVQVQQAQRALNLALSMIPRNVVTGGFLERVILGSQSPGEPELDKEGIATGRWLAKPFYTGAGTVNFLQASEHEGRDGDVKLAVQDVKWREPVKPDASIAASDKHYKSILDEVSQTHILMSGDATSSAVSRITARIDYLNTLLLTQPEAEGCLRFLMETVLAMGEAIANKPGFYTNVLRAQVQCKLDTGPLAPEERAAIEASIGKTISRETAMLLLNVDDPDAEIARMNADPLSRAALASAVGTGIQALTLGGVSTAGAIAFIGIEGDDLTALMTPDTFDETPATSDAPTATPGTARGAPTKPNAGNGNGNGNSNGNGNGNNSRAGSSAPRTASTNGTARGGNNSAAAARPTSSANGSART